MSPDEILNGEAFPAADRAEWLSLAGKALKGAPFAEALVSRTDDGIPIEPLYPRHPDATARPRHDPGRRWRILQRIDDPDPVRANAQALADIEGGADGIALVFEGAPNSFGYGLPATGEALARVLNDVPLGRAALRIDTHPGNRTTAERLLALLAATRVDGAKLELSLGVDPAAVFAGTGRLRMSVESLEASMPQSLAHFFTLGVPAVLLEADGRVFHNAGATEAQELGAVLASAVTYLRLFERARQPLVYAVPHLGFCVSVDQDQLTGIAKLRALRALWRRVLEACSVAPLEPRVHAESSWRMIAARDPETNIVRNTVACFAAACGGADSVALLPHTIAHGLPDAFARRLARNTQLVLAEESHVGFVADPACGSGAVEALTGALCEKAWDEFRRIEGEGGIFRSLETGALQDRITDAARERQELLAAGARTVVGTTLFPLSEEPPVATLPAARRPIPSEGGVFCRRLDPLQAGPPLDEAA